MPGLFVIKAVLIAVVLRLGRLNWGQALEGGLLLGRGGEFAFIIVSYATLTSLMTPQSGQFIMIVVGLSMFITPAAARFGSLLGDWWERRGGAENSDRHFSGNSA